MIVMAAGTSIITERSPFIVRTSFTLPQTTDRIAEWAAKNGIKKVVTLVSDYAPGHRRARRLLQAELHGRRRRDRRERRVPLRQPRFAPFLQRAKDAKPDALFVFVPSGAGRALMKQFVERGLDKAGIKIIGPGDVTDDDLLNGMGDAALGVITSHPLFGRAPVRENKAFVEAFKKAEQHRARTSCRSAATTACT